MCCGRVCGVLRHLPSGHHTPIPQHTVRLTTSSPSSQHPDECTPAALHSEWGLVKCVMSSVDKIHLHQPWKAWLLSSGVVALRWVDVVQDRFMPNRV